jgi:hypothetical protein
MPDQTETVAHSAHGTRRQDGSQWTQLTARPAEERPARTRVYSTKAVGTTN